MPDKKFYKIEVYEILKTEFDERKTLINTLYRWGTSIPTIRNNIKRQFDYYGYDYDHGSKSVEYLIEIKRDTYQRKKKEEESDQLNLFDFNFDEEI